MDVSSERGAEANEPPFQSARTFLAYFALLTGLAGTISVAPLTIWALASIGFH
jgi:hypothetical protein